jgi:hypothetical protein
VTAARPPRAAQLLGGAAWVLGKLCNCQFKRQPKASSASVNGFATASLETDKQRAERRLKRD